MPKYSVTHQDGRTTAVFAPDEPSAIKQANYQEMTRTVIAGMRGTPAGPDPSLALSALKLKD